MTRPEHDPSAAASRRPVPDRCPASDATWRRRLRRHRAAAALLVHGILAAASFALAFVLRFELSSVDRAPLLWGPWFVRSVGLVVALRLAVHVVTGLHRRSWRFVGVRDVVPLAAAVGLGSALSAGALLMVWRGGFPRSVLVIDAMLCLLLTAGTRLAYRLVAERQRGGRRVVVVGAGAAGDMVVRAMLTNGLAGFRPVALVDDDPLKRGTTLHGVPVAGAVADVAAVARSRRAAAVVLALPSATSAELYRAVGHCRATGLPLKTTPDLSRFLAADHVAPPLHDFRLEDLLNRRPVPADAPLLRRHLAGRTVLVTGAAGSIGSELCRQVVEQGAQRVVCLDRDENGLFRLEHRLRRGAGGERAVMALADVQDALALDRVFRRWRPAVVFHAAAYKHVPVLQDLPVAAVRNNVQGTVNVADLADRHGAAEFVLISTDKAVNPTSVMGASKRVAERVVRARDRASATRFSVIRFGNVLGSNGSVVELFREQIRRGGPVTVTHPEMERYFMTIPEAVHLVLCAAALGGGGETYILDMGSPVRIAELACQMIRLSGLTPEVDVPVVYTGLRPGEKLTEELWTARETPLPTTHDAILRAPAAEGLDPADRGALERLLAAAARHDASGCWQGLRRLVPGCRAVPATGPAPAAARVDAAPPTRTPAAAAPPAGEPAAAVPAGI